MSGAAGAPNITDRDPLPPRPGPRGASAPAETDRADPIAAGLLGLCPRCSARTLFAGVAGFAPACRMCGLDFRSFNVGDGPAAFLILIVGGIVVALAIAVELALGPPWWVHVLLWLPTATLLTLGSLRVAKGIMLALEYRHLDRG